MAEREWGLCKDCKWWQIEPGAAIENLTMGLCIEEKLQPYRLRVSGNSGCIADRLPAHKTPAVLAWLAEHPAQIEVFYLPAYSPELNPVEYLNGNMKGTVNEAGLPDNPGVLQTRIQKFMNKLSL